MKGSILDLIREEVNQDEEEVKLWSHISEICESENKAPGLKKLMDELLKDYDKKKEYLAP